MVNFFKTTPSKPTLLGRLQDRLLSFLFFPTIIGSVLFASKYEQKGSAATVPENDMPVPHNIIETPTKTTPPAKLNSAFNTKNISAANIVETPAPVKTSRALAKAAKKLDLANTPLTDEAFKLMIDLLKKREGYRNDVYLDKKKNQKEDDPHRHPTVGFGHLVVSADNLKVGDVISDERALSLLEHDAIKAYALAKADAAELNITSPEFVAVLGSLNYQIPRWKEDMPATLKHLKGHDFAGAARMIDHSTLKIQTPIRAEDFKQAVLEEGKKHLQPTNPQNHAPQPAPLIS